MQNLEAPVELDFKETNEEWEGKWLTEGAYDSIVHTKDYEYGVNIFSPASSFDPIPIATVIPNVYENRDHLVDTLNNINETSTMRANAAGPIDHEEMKKNIIAGFNVTCIGDDRTYSFLPSRNGDTLSDKVAKHILKWIEPN